MSYSSNVKRQLENDVLRDDASSVKQPWTPQVQSGLLQLPREIRDHILRELLFHDEPLIAIQAPYKPGLVALAAATGIPTVVPPLLTNLLGLHDPGNEHLNGGTRALPISGRNFEFYPAILRASRQFYGEGSQILYYENVIKATVWSDCLGRPASEVVGYDMLCNENREAHEWEVDEVLPVPPSLHRRMRNWDVVINVHRDDKFSKCQRAVEGLCQKLEEVDEIWNLTVSLDFQGFDNFHLPDYLLTDEDVNSLINQDTIRTAHTGWKVINGVRLGHQHHCLFVACLWDPRMSTVAFGHAIAEKILYPFENIRVARSVKFSLMDGLISIKLPSITSALAGVMTSKLPVLLPIVPDLYKTNGCSNLYEYESPNTDAGTRSRRRAN